MTAFDDPCMRPRYREMTDPHEGNDGDGPLGIRVISYLGDYDDYFDCEVIAPFGSEAERDAELRRLSRLPGMYGRLEFEPCTLSLRQLGWTRFDAEPGDVARATTFREFMAGFKHDDGWLDEDDSDDDPAPISAAPVIPGDMTLDGLGSVLEALGRLS